MSTKETNSTGTIVITGTSTGIGRATAVRLASLGFKVFAGVRKASEAPEASGITPLTIDVTDAASITAAAETVAAQVGSAGLRGLVNNAGITVPGPLEFLPLEDLRRQLEVNVIGPIAVTQAFLPLLRKGHGRIVNIGSIGGKMSMPFLGAYHVSKFGMEALSDSLRQELRPWGIRVSLIEPGGVKTPLWERGRAAADELLARVPQETHDYYGEAMESTRGASDKFEKRGSAPDVVAKAIQHALTAKNPKTRYLVGMDARAQAFLCRVLPDQAMDRVLAWQMGLPKKPPKAKKSAPERQPEDSLT
jgi:NAD(P)-dependent dehydrogenase (short-subunit alcohol dehydrogenase family)